MRSGPLGTIMTENGDAARRNATEVLLYITGGSPRKSPLDYRFLNSKVAQPLRVDHSLSSQIVPRGQRSKR